MKKGFTLLEMLVVIGIIAVLVGMGAVSYSTAQKKARDAKRKGDLTAIKNCMEQNYANNATTVYTYQTLSTTTSPAADTLSGTIDCGGATTITAPTDPLNNSTYYYRVTDSDSDSYTITVSLESGSSTTISNQQ